MLSSLIFFVDYLLLSHTPRLYQVKMRIPAAMSETNPEANMMEITTEQLIEIAESLRRNVNPTTDEMPYRSIIQMLQANYFLLMAMYTLLEERQSN